MNDDASGVIEFSTTALETEESSPELNLKIIRKGGAFGEVRVQICFNLKFNFLFQKCFYKSFDLEWKDKQEVRCRSLNYNLFVFCTKKVFN